LGISNHCNEKLRPFEDKNGTFMDKNGQKKINGMLERGNERKPINFGERLGDRKCDFVWTNGTILSLQDSNGPMGQDNLAQLKT